MTTLKTTVIAAINYATRDLGLNKRPTVQMDNTIDCPYVMAATGTVYGHGLITKTITKTKSDYILHINRPNANKALKTYAKLFGNKQAAYDYIYLIICHELRHMWQYQSQYSVGTTIGGFNTDELFYGHGASDVEMDANKYMIEVAKRRGLEHLACYMEKEQRSTGMFTKYDTEFNKQIVSDYRNAVKNYNKFYSCLMELLYRK